MTSSFPLRALFLLAAITCLLPAVSSSVALLVGMAFALTLGNPLADRTRKLTPLLLQASIVGLGAGMDLAFVARAGIQGFGYTIAGIAFTFGVGTLLGKAFATERDLSLLITSGTAICGGSAIAAVSSTIRARPEETSVALATVFFLNALALFLFPPLGHALGMSQEQFGLWSALAIHDTSSVVGASLQFGPRALELATTVKLARALWIVPLAFAIGALRAAGSGRAAGKAKRPWFILGFVLAAATVTAFPALRPAGHLIEALAKRSLVLTLFLIGSGLTRATLRATGLRPLLQGSALWVMVSTATLAAILSGMIR